MVLFENQFFSILQMAIPVYQSVRIYTVGVNKKITFQLHWTIVWWLDCTLKMAFYIVPLPLCDHSVSFCLRWTIIQWLDYSLTNSVLHHSISVHNRFISVSFHSIFIEPLFDVGLLTDNPTKKCNNVQYIVTFFVLFLFCFIHSITVSLSSHFILLPVHLRS